MSFGAKQISKLDLNNRKYIGIGLPFNKEGIFTQTFITRDAIRNNLINFFLTNNGDRYMNYSFGSNLRRELFENMSTTKIEDIKSGIRDRIQSSFREVRVDKLTVSPDEKKQRLNIDIIFSITDSGERSRINITL